MHAEPLSAALGAEVTDVDLRSLDAETTAELRSLLLEHKVIGVRNQHLDDDTHIAVAAALGEPWIHPMDRLAGVAEAAPSELRVTSDHQLQTDTWHLDVLYAPTPPAFGILCALSVPPVGGDTMWSNLTLAAQQLPAELRTRLLGAYTVHDVPDILVALRSSQYPDLDPDIWRNELTGVRQPLLRQHPETGEVGLFCVGESVVENLDETDAAALMSEVTAHGTNLNYTCRWRWSDGDVVIWDERCTAHYAVRDPWEGERVLRRLLVEGDAAVAAHE